MAKIVGDDDEWDAVETRAVGFAADLQGASVTVLFRRVHGEWHAELLVAPSAALREVGARGLGLYTLRPLQGRRQTRMAWTSGSRIGRYGGAILGTFEDIAAPQARAQIESWARAGRDSLLAMRVNTGEGISIVDGAAAPQLPYLHRINDAQGLRRSNNVRFAENGVAFATRAVPAANLQSATLAGIAASELFVSYDAGAQGFWRIHRTLGQQENPLVIERDGRGTGPCMPALFLKM